MMTLLQVEQESFWAFLLEPRKNELHGLIDALPIDLVRTLLHTLKTQE